MALRRARAIHNWRAAEVEEPTADLEQRRQVAGRPPASHRQVTGKSPATRPGYRQLGQATGKLPASHRQLGQATGKLPAGHRQVKGWRRPGQGLATARRPAGCRQLAGNPPATRRQRFSWLQGQIAGEIMLGGSQSCLSVQPSAFEPRRGGRGAIHNPRRHAWVGEKKVIVLYLSVEICAKAIVRMHRARKNAESPAGLRHVGAKLWPLARRHCGHEKANFSISRKPTETSLINLPPARWLLTRRRCCAPRGLAVLAIPRHLERQSLRTEEKRRQRIGLASPTTTRQAV